MSTFNLTEYLNNTPTASSSAHIIEQSNERVYLFTSYDGVKIYAGDSIFSVNAKLNISEYNNLSTPRSQEIIDEYVIKYFSTLEAAKAYANAQTSFITNDAATVHIGMKVWFVNTKWELCDKTLHKGIQKHNIGSHVFAHKENAERFIIANKPCLSINDINAIQTISIRNLQEFENLVKSK